MPEPVALARIASHLEEFDGAFLECTDCLVVHRIRRADRAAIYASDGTETPADDFRRFLSEHGDHRFQVLRRSSDAEMLSHARWDPMCRVAWEVSDGEHDFVVVFGRTDVERPREYALLPARMRLLEEVVELDAETLARVIDEALYPRAASHAKIQAVVARCQALVRACPTDELDPIDEERDDPNVQLACLPPRVAAELRRDLARILAPAESDEVLDSIVEDLGHHIPIVRLTRRYRIERYA